MKVHCLGTTGFHPSPSRHTACYYIPDLDLVLDAGTGIFRLVPHLIESPRESLTILLSHAHLDHVVGLTFLVDALAVTSLTNIRLIGDPEKLDVVREHLYQPLLFPVEPSMKFEALPSGQGSLPINDSCEIDWFPLEHPGGSIGYCIKAQEKKFSYVTDTVARPDAAYLEAIRDSDLLLHECYFGDEHEQLAIKTGHSWTSAVLDVIERTNPKQSGLIHINPLAEMLGTEISLPEELAQKHRITVARDEMVFEF